MAIITRWRMPPDIWCGYSCTRRSGSGMRTAAATPPPGPSPPASRCLWCSRSASLIWTPTVMHRVERGHRLLEDHRDVVAADRVASAVRSAPAGCGPSNRIAPLSMRPGGSGHQAHDGQRRHALAAAGLADDAERFALAARVGDAVHRAHDTGRGEELGVELIDLQHGRGTPRRCLAGQATMADSDVPPKIVLCYILASGWAGVPAENVAAFPEFREEISNGRQPAPACGVDTT